MLDQKLIGNAMASLRGLNFMLSNLTDTRTDCKMIGIEDIEALVGIDEDCFEDLYYDANEFKEEIMIPSSYGIIAYGNMGKGAMRVRAPLAYMLAHSDEPKKNVPAPLKGYGGNGSYIVSCAVVPQVQRRGVFKNMLACFEEITKMQGMNHFRLHTRTAENPDNTEAHKAFLKLGFEITGVIKDHYDKGDDVYEMVKGISR
jgi:ribosomal protein S18 acetylase RimI-like enzyme